MSLATATATALATAMATAKAYPSSPRAFAFPFVENYNVCGSSFFRRGAELPTPDEVRMRANSSDFSTRGGHLLRPPLQRFREHGVAVKFGNHVSIAEAHCLLFLRAHAPTIPVPELFGWRRDKRQTFIYMEDIDGNQAYGLGGLQLEAVAQQIRAVVDTLRQIPQSLVSPVPFVGHVNGTHVRDWCFVNSSTPPAAAGPFPGVAAFHDWLAYEHGKPSGSEQSEFGRYRAQLPDDAAITLTHGGLTPDNILVSRPTANGTVQLLAVVDWSQAGWYPLYWEGLREELTGMGDEQGGCMDACDFFMMNASS